MQSSESNILGMWVRVWRNALSIFNSEIPWCPRYREIDVPSDRGNLRFISQLSNGAYAQHYSTRHKWK